MPRTAPSLSFIPLPLILGLVLGAAMPAQAQVNCKATSGVVDNIFYGNKGKVDALRKEHSDATLALSCIQLQEQSLEQKETKPEWIGDKVQANAWFDACTASGCQDEGPISNLLDKVCPKLGRPDCNLTPPLPVPKPLTKWRRALGGVLVGVGALSVVLGAVHMGVPLATLPSGCTAYGLDHPCVADRFPTGGALLGSGLLVAGGGILALTLP